MNNKSRIRTSKNKAVALFTAMALVVTGVIPLGALGGGVTEAYGAHWADSFLNNLSTQNVMRGDENGNMKPDKNITRAEFVAMINRAFGFTLTNNATFSDVPADAWYARDIGIGAYQGYFTGTGEGKAQPMTTLNREEAVTMLCRALKIEEVPVDTLKFADSSDFSSWSRGNINAASQKNIISGYPDNTFRSKRPITRGEAAKVLSNLAGTIVQSGSQVYLGYVDGNVTLSHSGAGLRDTTITGDLYITEGVQSGYVYLDNVTVLGSIIISGGGESNVAENSIIMTDCSAGNVIIDLNHGKTLSLVSEGDTEIDNTVVKSSAFLEERNTRRSAFENVDLKGPSDCVLNLSGSFEQVRIMAPGNTVNLNKGSIETLICDEDAPNAKIFLEKGTHVEELYTDGPVNVTGTGKIYYLSVGANGAIVEQLPDEIYIRPGVTAEIDGKEMGNQDAELENAYPRIENGYPEVKSITTTSADSLIKGNKPGKVYWVVKEDGSATPSDEEMKNPKESEAIIKSGTADLKDVEKEISAKLSGLTSGKSYDIYVMLEDSRGNTSGIRNEYFETQDKTAPKFIPGYPRATAVFEEVSGSAITPGAAKIGDHQIAFEAVTDKNTTAYYTVLPAKSIAPTALNVVDGRAPGQIKSGSFATATNQLSKSSATGLKEATSYDTYVVLKDGKGNLSSLIKLSVATLDVTAPEFEKVGNTKYPYPGTITDRSVTMLYMTNEKATLYWAAYKPLTFPAGDPGGTNQMNPDWQASAQKAIMTGNKAISKGTVNATADKESSFNVTGLAPQTAYDLFVFLEDAAGNRQIVEYQKITTKDDINPYVNMGFDETLISEEGYPPVGSNIRLVFSEPIFVEGMELPKALAASPAAMNDYCKLYNTSKNPRVEVPISFASVTASALDGHTELIFSTSSSTGSALQLVNGNNYLFEVKRSLRDMTGNELVKAPNSTQATFGEFVRLAPFRTQAPFIGLRDVGDGKTYDFIFEVDPKIKDADPDLLYDTVLESDRKISFQLYNRVSTGETTYGPWTPVSSPAIGAATTFTLPVGEYTPIQTLITDLNNAEYSKFNDLKKCQYGVKIVTLDGNDKQTSWSGKATLKLRGVAGSGSGMKALAAAGGPGSDVTFDAFMKSAEAANVSAVSDPGTLTCTAYFQDVVAPEFIRPYPRVQMGDTTVQLTAMVDKPADIYWMAAPSANSAIGSDGTLPLNAEQLIARQYKPQGYVWNTFRVDSASAAVNSIILSGLAANTEYNVFFAAKGTRASTVGAITMTTSAVIAPEWANSYPSWRGSEANAANIDFMVRKANANIYWVAYPTGLFDRNSIDPDKPDMPDPETIISASQSPGQGGSVAQGVETVAQESISRIKVTLPGQGGENYYDFFAVAQNPLGGNYSSIGSIWGITPLTTSVPKLTAITVINPVVGTPASLSGTVTISSNQPLHYMDSNGEWHALTKAIFIDPDDGLAAGAITVVRDDIKFTPKEAPTSITIPFTRAMQNSSLSFPYPLGNGTNSSGRLWLTFNRDKTDFYDSSFKLELLK